MLTRLRETYCDSVGYEYMHIPENDRCNWIRERIETVEPVSVGMRCLVVLPCRCVALG